MTDRTRALFILNGFGLLALSLLIGWTWFFALLERFVLWPFPIDIQVNIPDDGRAWRMAHMEAITHGLVLLGIGAGGRLIILGSTQLKWLFWSALATTWLFTIQATLNALLGTRGLAFGGGPFKPGLANDVIYLSGYIPVVGVHIMISLALLGVWHFLKQQKNK